METEIGRITHYYNHLNVAALLLSSDLKLGDMIHILGHVTDFTQKVDSMEIERHAVTRGKQGEEVAIKATQPVRVNDIVYRITE